MSDHIRALKRVILYLNVRFSFRLSLDWRDGLGWLGVKDRTVRIR